MEVSALHPSNLEALAIPQFGELSRAERDMLRAAAKGDFPSFGNSAIWDDPSNDPAQADSWGGERVIRAELIRWLCLNEEASRQVDVRGVRVAAAKITGKLDLSYATVRFPLALLRCCLTADALLTHVRIPELVLNGSRTRCLLAEGAEVNGNLLLQQGFSAEGEVRLIAAHIGSSLNCRGSTFSNPTSPVSGGCSDPHEGNNRGKAIRADRIKVEGGIFLNKGFKADGEVMLNGASVGGDLSCKGGTFKNLSAHALTAENADVAGSVFLNDGFNAYGTVDLLGAKIGASLNCFNAIFDRVLLVQLVVKGIFIWSQVQNATVVQLDLRNATVGAMADDEKSWPARGYLHLDGFEYGRISGTPTVEDSFGEEYPDEEFKELAKSLTEQPVKDSPTDARTRLRWLDRDTQFALQPYRQLAKVLNAMGDDEGSQQVLFEMEDRARAFARRRLIMPMRLPTFAKDFVLKERVGYGIYPMQALWSLVGLWLMGCWR